MAGTNGCPPGGTPLFGGTTFGVPRLSDALFCDPVAQGGSAPLAPSPSEGGEAENGPDGVGAGAFPRPGTAGGSPFGSGKNCCPTRGANGLVWVARPGGGAPRPSRPGTG